MKDLTCWSCRWSVVVKGDWYGPNTRRQLVVPFSGLFCIITEGVALERCNKFEYEPGSDESERAADQEVE